MTIERKPNQAVFPWNNGDKFPQHFCVNSRPKQSQLLAKNWSTYPWQANNLSIEWEGEQKAIIHTYQGTPLSLSNGIQVPTQGVNPGIDGVGDALVPGEVVNF